jgi:hypothetical protein
MERWKLQTATLLRTLDAATLATGQEFGRLFDETIGQPSRGYFKRRMHLNNPSPSAIAGELEDQLAAAAILDEMLRTLRPALLKHYRECEDHLLRIIEQRQRVDFDIEDLQRRSDVLLLQIADRRSGIASGGDRVALAALEEERKVFVTEREALHAKELEFKPERETLQRLISIYEDFVDALNGHIASVNAMTGKLAVDNEQRITLLKAAQAQLDGPPGEAPAPVAALIAAFDANVLAGHDLFDRKAIADQAFARRLDARPETVQQPEDAENETAPGA